LLRHFDLYAISSRAEHDPVCARDQQTLLQLNMEEIWINKDTQLCMSLAARPGNFGTRFHNFLYRELGLNYVYKAFTTRDLGAAIGGIRALGIRGCAISMPFKEACIEYLDELDPSAKGIMSVNTIVNTDGYLKAFNTDYTAVSELIRLAEIPVSTSFALRGSGGMAKAVACALKDAGFRDGIIVARNEATGSALARQYNFQWKKELENERPGLLVNVTPVGMAGGAEADQLSFSEELTRAAQFIFDVVALPPETPLIRLATSLGKKTITGAAVIALQAVEQFVLYTGVRPDTQLVEKAAAFARS
jgi:shikimate dehydrogenase